MPSWARVVLPLLALVIASSATAWLVQGWRYDARIERMLAEHAQAISEAQSRARAIEQQMHAQLEIERENHQRDLRETQAALAAARDQSERLRNTIAAERRRATEAARAAGADPRAAAAPWVVLEECRAEYAEVARAADELSARLRLAAGYARAVNAE